MRERPRRATGACGAGVQKTRRRPCCAAYAPVPLTSAAGLRRGRVNFSCRDFSRSRTTAWSSSTRATQRQCSAATARAPDTHSCHAVRAPAAPKDEAPLLCAALQSCATLRTTSSVIALPPARAHAVAAAMRPAARHCPCLRAQHAEARRAGGERDISVRTGTRNAAGRRRAAERGRRREHARARAGRAPCSSGGACQTQRGWEAGGDRNNRTGMYLQPFGTRDSALRCGTGRQ